MKLYKYLILSLGFIVFSSCDDTENDVVLSSEFDYLAFESSAIGVSEAGGGPVLVMITRSTGDINKELSLNYTISAPATGRPAIAGTDYTLPAGSGTIVFPSGQATVQVPLIDLIDNDLSVGNRSINFEIDDPKGFLLGSPDAPETGALVLTINEDDLFTFGETSFEEVTTFVGDRTFPKTPTVEQVNSQVATPNSTDPLVDWTRTGAEMGFDTSSLASNLVDLGGEAIGVFSNENMETDPDSFETRFVNGTQGYLGSDLDGTLEVRFDELMIPAGTTNLVLEISYFMGQTYEDEEGFFVYWETADGLGDALVFEQGPAAQVSQWITVQVPIPAARAVNGRVLMQLWGTADAETIFVDYVAIKGIK
ncbi:hypothetical protein [Nonlabens antarcticus]|uniref:hypothetical protein n=1 Tax=Nonlabens antarcticus TaxID=392714 RepID=UPI0018915893|nr:hypothetical protein [Nonlabens antarcticus]